MLEIMQPTHYMNESILCSETIVEKIRGCHTSPFYFKYFSLTSRSPDTSLLDMVTTSVMIDNAEILLISNHEKTRSFLTIPLRTEEMVSKSQTGNAANVGIQYIVIIVDSIMIKYGPRHVLQRSRTSHQHCELA